GVRSHVAFVESPPDCPSPSSHPEPADAREEQRLFDSFWEQFASLDFTKSEKQVFWLSARYGYTMKEIGEKLGIPHSTAHDWLKSVKERCLQYLNSGQDHA
ncbi:MAG: sigma-70 family RNA polymerase sigma factor, partial [Verrucomicrobiae bacterium]|nr:sigma-70 family RNA polymerase sigma factor [Verrucomicrobiae bacterium]